MKEERSQGRGNLGKRSAVHFLFLGAAPVVAAAPEDVFLMKAMTERERDLDDMAALYSVGLDRQMILKEFRAQADGSPSWLWAL